ELEKKKYDLGIRSMKKVIKKYDGAMKLYYYQDSFHAEILLTNPLEEG
ncbi:MAG: GHKL domain-containing protein, partial [Holdemanella sp.]|nr:GHKL domain-containing protein [Holdemanella sp.]